MFSGGTTNPYDEIVVKATDENLTSENWEIILTLCDKVQDEGQDGAHNVVAAVLKRLAHRNPNVQLYALSLAESLSKNLGIELHREIASKAFTQGLEKLVIDRMTHDKVKRRTLSLVLEWTTEFENDTSLGIMEECYNNLKAKGYKFEMPTEPLPPTVDDEIRRKEEEELQRVLEMSMQDKGGRGAWTEYSLASSSGAGGSGSGSTVGRNGVGTSAPSSSKPAAGKSSPPNAFTQPKYQSGYVPARTPSPKVQQQYKQPEPQPQAQQKHHVYSSPQVPASVSAPVSPPTQASSTTPEPSASAMPGNLNIVTRVRALHTFEPTEPGELAFEKGDVIKVVDRGYKDWWRGQLKGRTGIFPVNYVESMPEPTAAELAKEAEQEAAVFAQAVNVEKLLNMLRALDPDKDNLADNEEIQELYRSSMALRPKIVKLIDKYSQKRADLVSMNETFVRARTIFDRMMEESLARHTGVYDQQSSYRQPKFSQGRPEYGAQTGPQGYGWSQQPGYNAYPVPANAFPTSQPEAVPAASPYGGGAPQQQQQPYADPNAAAYAQSQAQAQAQQVPAYGYSAPYGQQGPIPYPAQQPQQQQPRIQGQQPIQQAQPLQQQPSQTQQVQQQAIQQAQPVQYAQPAQQAQPIQQAQVQPVQQAQQNQPIQASQQPNQQHPDPYQAHSAQSYQTVQQLQQPIQQAQPLQQAQPQPQQQVQAQPIQAQIQADLSPEPQPQTLSTQPQQQQQAGPPYVFDPSTTYSDPNVQAWAQYYAQGGRDLAGSVYFISIPGLTDGAPHSPQHTQGLQAQQQATQSASQDQQQQQQQTQPQQGYAQVHQSQGQQGQHLQQVTEASPARYGSAAENITIYPAQQRLQQPQSSTSDPAYAADPHIQSQALPQLTRVTLVDNPVPAQQLQPVQVQPAYIADSGVSSGRSQSPVQAMSSTPSWVLPKKTVAKPGVSGGSPPSSLQGHGDRASGSYFPLTNQLGNLNVDDGGNKQSGLV